MRLAVSARGAEIELTGVHHGVATLRLSLKGCGTGAAGIEHAVRDALLTAVPELSAVTFVPAEQARPGDLRAAGCADAARPVPPSAMTGARR